MSARAPLPPGVRPDEPPALDTEALVKRYEVGGRTVTAVDGVSLRVRPGEFVALVGPSGSGKTTVLAMLAGLLRPSSGRVSIAGRDVQALSDRALTGFRRRNVGFTFQANNLLPYLTVRENVTLMLALNGGRTRAGVRWAEELLERLGLGDRLGSLPAQLSGGEQQRVSIARALVHRPELVLADEPTASLDTERAYQVVATFAALVHEERRAAVMVTHDLRMCRHVDRVVQMRDGTIEREIDGRDAVRRFAEAAP